MWDGVLSFCGSNQWFWQWELCWTVQQSSLTDRARSFGCLAGERQLLAKAIAFILNRWTTSVHHRQCYRTISSMDKSQLKRVTTQIGDTYITEWIESRQFRKQNKTKLTLRLFSAVCACLIVLMFYGPVNPMGSYRARPVYLTTRLLGRLSPLSG